MGTFLMPSPHMANDIKTFTLKKEIKEAIYLKYFGAVILYLYQIELNVYNSKLTTI